MHSDTALITYYPSEIFGHAIGNLSCFVKSHCHLYIAGNIVLYIQNTLWGQILKFLSLSCNQSTKKGINGLSSMSVISYLVICSQPHRTKYYLLLTMHLFFYDSQIYCAFLKHRKSVKLSFEFWLVVYCFCIVYISGFHSNTIFFTC